MKLTIAAVSCALAASAALNSASAQQPPAAVENGAANLAMALLPAKSTTKLTVTSPAFAHGADIPFENTQYKGNIFPGLAWTAGPAGTKSYALIMQDGDSRGATPYLHWILFNIPANMVKLDAAMATPPTGAFQIRPYNGPRTPAGPKHRYHFQIFALDVTLPQDSTTTNIAGVTAAMKDHVLASGELIGLGQIMPPPQPR